MTDLLARPSRSVPPPPEPTGPVARPLWLGAAFAGAVASGAGAHVCFNASDADAVVAFHEAGLAAGGYSDGAPGPRPEYAPGYYAAFLRDPDGNKVEAMCWIARPGAA